MPTEALLNKALSLETTLDSLVVERSREIHCMSLALYSGQHLFFYSLPGLAKSLVVGEMAKRISGANYFPLLFGADTTPDAIFGPYSIKDLREGKYLRLTEGYLPWAHIFFGDEIWKLNDGSLNSMLTALNEREFDNGGKRYGIPLSSVFCASNELPGNESLAAIYDRILLRVQLHDIQEPANVKRMLLAPKPEKSPTPILSWSEIEEIKAEVANVKMTEEVAEILVKIRKELHGLNIFPSPRRVHQSISVLQAEAWLDGCDEIFPEHIGVLGNVYWERPDQIAQVEEIVLQTANPVEKKGLALLAGIDVIGDLVQKAKDAQDTDERQRLGVEAHKKVQAASKEYHDLSQEAGSSRRQQTLLERCREKLHTHAQVLITDVFHLPPDTNPVPGAAPAQP